jgi:hypothetical protein
MILDDDAMLVFEEDISWEGLVDDLAENAVVHEGPSLQYLRLA